MCNDVIKVSFTGHREIQLQCLHHRSSLKRVHLFQLYTYQEWHITKSFRQFCAINMNLAIPMT